MAAIFVNYRQNRRLPGGRAEQRGHAQTVEAIADRLRRHFGRTAVFIDTGMRAATRYPDELRRRLAGSELVIAVIHREWLDDLRDREGELDWVRHELATALARGTPVLPVLLAGARLPEAAELPPEVAELAKCQAHAIRFGQWEHGVRALLDAAEAHVSPEPLPEPEPQPRPRGRHPLGIPLAAAAGAALPVAAVHRLVGGALDRWAWLTALAIALVTLSAVAAGTAALVHAARKPVDRVDAAWARRPGDEKTNVVVGMTIAGLAMVVLLTADIPAELQVLTLAVVVVVVMVLGTQWISHRESALTWPQPWLPATPAAVRSALARVRGHLDRPAPISRADRDKAEFALAQVADRLDALRDQQSARRPRRLLAASPAVTLPHAAVTGAALGTTTAALVAHLRVGGDPWPGLAWAAAGCIATAACYLAAVDITYRLARWRRRVVLESAPDEVAALRARIHAAA